MLVANKTDQNGSGYDCCQRIGFDCLQKRQSWYLLLTTEKGRASYASTRVFFGASNTGGIDGRGYKVLGCQGQPEP